jgi:hypothetical protein
MNGLDGPLQFQVNSNSPLQFDKMTNASTVADLKQDHFDEYRNSESFRSLFDSLNNF